MATTIAFGDDKTNPPDDTLTLDVPSGATVNVAVIDGDTVNYYLTQPDESGPTGTITNGSNQNFTSPAWLTSNSRSSITLTGGNY